MWKGRERERKPSASFWGVWVYLSLPCAIIGQVWVGEEGRKAFAELELTQGGVEREFWEEQKGLSRSFLRVEGLSISEAEAWSAGCTWGLTHPLSSPAETAGGR